MRTRQNKRVSIPDVATLHKCQHRVDWKDVGAQCGEALERETPCLISPIKADSLFLSIVRIKDDGAATALDCPIGIHALQ
jgi:hypothetical protein